MKFIFSFLLLIIFSLFFSKGIKEVEFDLDTNKFNSFLELKLDDQFQMNHNIMEESLAQSVSVSESEKIKKPRKKSHKDKELKNKTKKNKTKNSNSTQLNNTDVVESEKKEKHSFLQKTETTSETNRIIPNNGDGKIKITKTYSSPLNTDLRLPDTDIYFQGWARYYHYSINTKDHISKPKLFFQNDVFFNQRIKRPEQKKKDKLGFNSIPNKAAFYIVLYNNTLSVFSSRDDPIKRQIDSLPIKFLGRIPEDNIDKGSVREMGEHPTGSCLDIKCNVPGSLGEKTIHYWYVCFDNSKQKHLFKTALIRLKIRSQREMNIIPITTDQLRIPYSLSSEMRLRKPVPDENKAPVNGYWILLQDWTDCTLTCGGGWNYQHWMCVPPKNGGLPCQGEAIRRKACNIQPCPNASAVLNKRDLLAFASKTIKPSIKVGRFSSRPQRYSKCQIKENDAFLTEFDKVKKDRILKKIPVRVIMNNHTLSIFQDDDYSDMLFTFNLKTTSFYQKERHCCFSIVDREKQKSICGYPENCGSAEKNEWASKWREDFTLFKTICHTGRQDTLLTESDINHLHESKLDPLGIDIDKVKRRKKELQDELINDREDKFLTNLKQTEDLGFKAIQRELDIENMIKKEENARENIDIIDLEDKIKKEEKKAKCIKKKIQEKDLDDSWEEKVEEQEELALLKKKMNLKIEAGRYKIKELLAKMRKKAKNRKADLEDKLKSIRAKMAADILLANKEGSYKPCIKGKVDSDFRENYCNKAFVDDFLTNSSCKDESNYCYTCCENEFGNEYMVKRSQCYKICDGADKKTELTADNGGEGKNKGVWTWAPVEETKTAEIV